MATHSSVLAWRIPVDTGAWQATVHGVTELDMTERLSTHNSKSGSWSSPFTLKSLLVTQPALPLPSVQDLCGSKRSCTASHGHADGARRLQNFLDLHPPHQTLCGSSLAGAGDGSVLRAQGSVFITRGNSGQVTVRCLCERLAVSLEIDNH